MTSTVLYPPLIDDLGQPASPRAEDYIEAHEIGRTNAYATTGLGPLGWNHGKPDGTRMVGWTLHKAGRLIDQHAFSINPQGITRSPSSRNQMFATQGEFYVDDFGPGSEAIQLTQMVAHGRATAGGGGQLSRATMREDVIRFYDRIYTRAQTDAQVLVYFHDNHLWNQPNGRTPELVYFPAQAFQLVRSVQQHNVWLIQLTMQTLQPPATKGRATAQIPGQPKIRVHVVRKGETLPKIAAKLAGGKATHKRRLQLQQQIIALTKKYGADDITKNRDVPTFSATNPQQQTGLAHVTRNHLAPGEKIVLPAA